MTRVDWTIIAVAAFGGLLGFRRGLIRTVLSFVGLAAGAVFGARLAPHLLSHVAASHYSALVGLGGAVAGAIVLQIAATLAGRLLRAGLRLAPPLRLLDSLGGLVAGVAWVLTLAWVAGAVATQIPGHPQWEREAHRSKVLHRLNALVPPGEVLRLRAALLLEQFQH